MKPPSRAHGQVRPPGVALEERVDDRVRARHSATSPTVSTTSTPQLGEQRRRDVRARREASRSGVPRRRRRATDRACRRPARDNPTRRAASLSRRTRRARRAAGTRRTARARSGGCASASAISSGTSSTLRTLRFVERLGKRRRSNRSARAARCRASTRRTRARPPAERFGRSSRRGRRAGCRRPATSRRPRRRAASTRAEPSRAVIAAALRSGAEAVDDGQRAARLPPRTKTCASALRFYERDRRWSAAVLLQAARRSGLACERLRQRPRRIETRQTRNTRFDRGAANLVVVGDFARPFGVVDDQIDCARRDQVEHVRRAVGDLVDRARSRCRRFAAPRACRASRPACARARRSARSTGTDSSFSSSAIETRMRPPLPGRRMPAAEKPFAQRAGERLVDSEHLAGRLHLRSEHRLDAAHLRKREHRHFDDDVRHVRTQPDAVLHVAQLLAERDARRGGDQIDAGRLLNDRNGAARARIRFDDVELAVVDDELDVDQARECRSSRAIACVTSTMRRSIAASIVCVG